MIYLYIVGGVDIIYRAIKVIYLYIVGGVDIIYRAIKVGDISIYSRRGRHYIQGHKGG